MERVGLQPARYIQAAAYRTISRYRDMKCHDISISLLGYDMITSQVWSKVQSLDQSLVLDFAKLDLTHCGWLKTVYWVLKSVIE